MAGIHIDLAENCSHFVRFGHSDKVVWSPGFVSLKDYYRWSKALDVLFREHCLDDFGYGLHRWVYI